MQPTLLLAIFVTIILGSADISYGDVVCGGQSCSTKCVACLDSANKPVTKCDSCPPGLKPAFGDECKSNTCKGQCVFCVNQKSKKTYKACNVCPSGVGVAYASQA